MLNSPRSGTTDISSLFPVSERESDKKIIQSHLRVKYHDVSAL